MTVAADNLPVIVGVGQLTSKVTEAGAAPSPLEMLETVSYRAIRRRLAVRRRDAQGPGVPGSVRSPGTHRDDRQGARRRTGSRIRPPIDHHG
jgi:hypothetical protein